MDFLAPSPYFEVHVRDRRAFWADEHGIIADVPPGNAVLDLLAAGCVRSRRRAGPTRADLSGRLNTWAGLSSPKAKRMTKFSEFSRPSRRRH